MNGVFARLCFESHQRQEQANSRFAGRVGRALPLSGLAMLCLLHGCMSEPDRRNPLDPESPRFQDGGTIAGETLTFFSPFLPLPNVEVVVLNGNRRVVSDANGQFTIADLPGGNYVLQASKSGYATATDTVEVQTAKVARTRLNLDGLPTVDSVQVISGHMRDPFSSDDRFFVELSAKVDDPDGVNDVVQVVAELPDLAFSDTLELTPTLGLFRDAVGASRLPGGEIEVLLGRLIFFKAFDRAGNSQVSQPVALARVIRATPRVVGPQGFELLNDPHPTLTWQPAELPFPFSYGVDVVQQEFGLETPIWRSDPIASDATSIVVEPALSAGVYFWTVSVVDQLGNFSTSIRASFRIN